MAPGAAVAAILGPDPSLFRPVQAALRARLEYTLGADWLVLRDTPDALELGYLPRWRTGDFDLSDTERRVVVGVPYGYHSVREVLALFRTERLPRDYGNTPVHTWCQGMARPRRLTLAGITGPGFFCDESIRPRPLYPTTRSGMTRGIAAALQTGDGWLIVGQDEEAGSVVLGIDGVPVVVTVFGGGYARRRDGPIAGIRQDVEATVQALHLTFGR